MFKLIHKIINLLLIRAEQQQQRRQQNSHQSSTDPFAPPTNSVFKYQERSIFGKRKYVGTLFEHTKSKKPEDRIRDNTAVRYDQIENQQNFPMDVAHPKQTQKAKGANATVVVFFVLLIIVGNVFPAAFRGVQFFFVAFLLLIVSAIITSKFE